MAAAGSRSRPGEGATRSSTIFFAPASNVLFHVGRCVSLARELAARGHRTVLAGTPRFLRDPAVVGSEECEFVPLPDFAPETALGVVRSIARAPDRRLVEELVEAEIRALRAVRPDLVVADFRPTMAVSACACGIPLVGLLLSHWLPGYAHALQWVPRTHSLGILVKRLFGERTGRRIASPIFRAAVRHKAAPLRAAARDRRQPVPTTLWECLQGDLNLLSDAEIAALPLPSNCRRVGPILWEPDVALPRSLLRIDAKRPVVYVTCGSTGDEAFFRRIFEEFGGAPWQVVVSTGDQIDAQRLEPPPNFVVERLLPGLATMRVADLVVYHGGFGTFQHAIREGVPGIVLATHWDQEYTGFLSEKHGLGSFLTLREVLASPGLLRRVASRMLGDLPDYRARVDRFRREFRGAEGTKSAGDSIEACLRGSQRRG